MPSRWTDLTGASALIGGLLFSLVFSPVASGRAATEAVDCDAGQRIQPAIDHARPGDTIVVSGSCSENVVFPEEAVRITLDGQETATLDAPPNAPPAQSTVTVLGRGITIRGFTMMGATNAIAVWRGGTAVIEGNTLSGGTLAGTGGQGINVAQHSYAQIVGNTIEANSNAGITVIEGSYARIGVIIPTRAQGNLIRNNGINGGVYVSRSSGARIGGNTISDNIGPGVLVDSASHAVVSANRIDGNGANGVTVTQNSSVWLGGDLGILAGPNATGVPNQGVGIRCALNSSADGHLATLTGTAGARGFDSSCTDNLAP